MRRIFFAFLVLPLLLNAQDKRQSALIDSLRRELSRSNADTNKIKQLDLLSFAFSTVNPDKGIAYAMEAKKLSETLGWKKGAALAYSDLGVNYEAQPDHAKALEYDGKALEIYRGLGEKNSIACVLANISLAYLAEGDYSKALESIFEAEKISENDRLTMTIIKEDIGIIYMRQGQYKKAADYFSIAQQMQQENKNEEGVARISGNLGIIEDANGNYSKALDYYSKAMKANEAAGNKNSMQINLANIGNAYAHLKNYSLALVNHFHALRISEELELQEAVATNKGNIGETYFFIAKDSAYKIIPDSLVKNSRETNLQQAIVYLEDAGKSCAQLRFFAPMIEFHDFLSEAYYMSGEYKKAYDTFRQNKKTSDSVFSAQDAIRIKTAETKRALDMKDKEIAITNLKSEKRRDENYLLLAGIVLLLLVTGFVLWTLWQRSAKHRNIMSDIASIQSHELRAPLARIIGLAKLLSMKNPDDPDNKKLVGHITESATELDIIVRKVVDKTTE